MLGPDAVTTAVLVGGRDPADQVRLVPWGDERVATVDNLARSPGPARRPRGGGAEVPPWPGRLAGPSPAAIHCPPWPAEICDGDGVPVSVTGRGVISAPPASVAIAGAPAQTVTGWAGPWPLEERWWEAGGRRKAWLQVLLDDGAAYLMARQAGRWWMEASYD
jgi:protein ImuB